MMIVDVIPENEKGFVPEELMLRKDGMLVRYRWDDGQRREYIGRDVTKEAYRHMDRHVVFDGDVRLSSVFEMVRRSDPEIFDAVVTDGFVLPQIRNYERLKASDGILKYDPDAYDNEKIDYLEILRFASVDEENKELSGLSRPDFHGVGVELREEYDMFQIGDRIPFGVEFCPQEEILDIPLRMNRKIILQRVGKAGNALKGDAEELSMGFTLGDVVRAIFWELSFLGAPEDVEEARTYLSSAVADISSGKV